ncbi:MAG TPA: polyphosphate kinase 1, partial [Myxococcales bacterium]
LPRQNPSFPGARVDVLSVSKQPSDAAALSDPRNFVNRELSTLSFIERILDEAADPSVPLFERVRFLSVLSASLDEFFMIRVAGLKQQQSGHVEETFADAMTPAEQLSAISQRCHALLAREDAVLLDEILPALEAIGLKLSRDAKLAAEFVEREVVPVLTPLALDPGHPFPHLRNKSLNLAVRFAGPAEARLRWGVVPVPEILPRMVPVADGFVLLEDAIAANVGLLFPGQPVDGCWPFRLTRNWDLSIDEEEAEDLLVTIEREVRKRDRGSAVRLQINAKAGEPVVSFLRDALDLTDADVYVQRRPLALADLAGMVLSRPQVKPLLEEPFIPALPVEAGEPLYDTLKKRDVLLHHPYESFEPVVSFIDHAADDPAVLAIKVVLYRAGQGNPIVQALQRAAENGKQVTALVELKARMDEEANIRWARELERAGVHVVYGLIGYKTHCKLMLVVRREPTGLRRYVHLGTGNYNPATARSYSDLSLFTANESLAEDAGALFNLLTGYSKPARWNKLLVAPLDLKAALLQLIEDEVKAGEAGSIVAKMNALADPDIIKALYRASRRGVRIDLFIRGVCCLRPGVEGLSERIRVTSLVDRFLEHSRIWHFHARGANKVFLASGDWMPRNFVRRVDIAFPIEEPELKERILGEILALPRADTVKASTLQPDGTYRRIRPEPGAQAVRAQEQFIALARRSAFSDVSRAASAERLLSGGELLPRRKGPRKRKS